VCCRARAEQYRAHLRAVLRRNKGPLYAYVGDANEWKKINNAIRKHLKVGKYDFARVVRGGRLTVVATVPFAGAEEVHPATAHGVIHEALESFRPDLYCKVTTSRGWGREPVKPRNKSWGPSNNTIPEAAAACEELRVMVTEFADEKLGFLLPEAADAGRASEVSIKVDKIAGRKIGSWKPGRKRRRPPEGVDDVYEIALEG
jgi:hypothetical protein